MINAKYLGEYNDGRKFDLIIEIDDPKLIENKYQGDAFVSGIMGKKRRVGRGGDSLSALCSSVYFVHSLLDEFVKSGGRIYYQSGELVTEISLEIFSGLNL